MVPTRAHSVWAWFIELTLGILILTICFGCGGFYYFVWEEHARQRRYEQEQKAEAEQAVKAEEARRERERKAAEQAEERAAKVRRLELEAAEKRAEADRKAQEVAGQKLEVERQRQEAERQKAEKERLEAQARLKAEREARDRAEALKEKEENKQRAAKEKEETEQRAAVIDYAETHYAVFWQRLRNKKWDGPYAVVDGKGPAAVAYRVKGEISVVDTETGKYRRRLVPKTCYFFLFGPKVADFQTADGGFEEVKKWKLAGR
jgi:DNA repair exonuclease SbcCD ATPase subunit